MFKRLKSKCADTKGRSFCCCNVRNTVVFVVTCNLAIFFNQVKQDCPMRSGLSIKFKINAKTL